MFIFSLPLLFISFITFFSAIQVFHDQTSFSSNASEASIDGDLTKAHKHLLKAGSFSSDFYSKTYLPLLQQYKSDIISRRNGDVNKLREMARLLLIIDSCDRTFPCILAEILSYRVDLFDDVMNHIPDDQKGECLKMMETGVDNMVLAATKPGTSKTDIQRVLKFGTKYEEYRKKYAPRINPEDVRKSLFY